MLIKIIEDILSVIRRYRANNLNNTQFRNKEIMAANWNLTPNKKRSILPLAKANMPF